MELKKILKRELQVAFSKEAQPIWMRVLKYIVLAILFYFIWSNKFFLLIVVSMFIGGLLLHLWVRHKTHGWTKSWGLWKHESERNIQELDDKK